MSELNPSEAQRKAMIDYAVEFEPKLKGGAGFLVDGMIEAANSIPEGAPVGTIARRPDGAFVAVRVLAEDLEQYWTYTCVDHSGPDDDWPDRHDADSWPVIFTPGEAVGSGPTTDGGETHDPTRDQGIQEYLEWSDTQINPDEEPDCGGDLCEDCIRWRTDPTAQQEPGESLSRGLGDIAAGRVSSRDDYLEVPKPRTPRVVDRLGVDEQGSRWRDRDGLEFRHDGTRWVSNSPFGDLYGEDYEPDALPPYTEITDGEAHE